MKLLAAVNVTDRELDRVQQRVGDAFERVARLFVDTAHTVQATLGASDTAVYHGLGSSPRGWLVTWANAAASVYEGTAAPDYSSYVNLKASAPVTVSLLFF